MSKYYQVIACRICGVDIDIKTEKNKDQKNDLDKYCIKHSYQRVMDELCNKDRTYSESMKLLTYAKTRISF